MRTWQRFVGFILVFAIAFSFPAPVLAGGNVSGKVLNTISPKDVVPNTPTPFWMDAYNTGNVDWTFTAAMTVRYPDGHDVDYERTSVHLKSGQTGIVTWSLSLPPGDYKVIFGLWKDNKVALGRSEWINFTVSAPLKPITPPPITSPPPVTPPPPQANVSGEITNTIFPSTLFADTSTPFRMDFKNTGNTGWTFIAAMTVRYPDGHDVDYERNPMNLPAGSNGGVAWNVSLPPGNYRVIFGLWKDEQTALTRSYWMDFTVSAPSSPPAVIVSAKITNVILPKTAVKADEQAIFQVDFVNTGDGAWNFLVSMSVKNPDGRVVDLGKIPDSLVFSRNGSVGFPYTFPSGGEYQVMFGVWRDEKTLLTQSDWLTVSVAEGLRNNNTQTNLSAKITDTVFPSVVTIGKGTEFRIEIKNTGSVTHTFTAVFTTKYPNDSSSDLPKIRINLDPGQSGPVSWSPSFQTQGEHQARFTIWKDDEIFLDRSDWMSFAVEKKIIPPPVVPPVVTPPPVTSPPPVTPPPPQTNVSGEITNTIFPTTMVSGNPAAFRMDFKNTGNTGWTFVAAMTIRYPDGHDVDYERISSYAAVGSNGAATWNVSLQPGNYRVIFGLWRGEQTALTRSYWMDFTVSAPPVVSPPPVTNPPPVVPPVVNPPVITPPPVTPPVIAPPVVNPPPVVPPSNRNPVITGTSVPAVVKTQSSAEFVMRYENTTVSGEYIAAATIRHPDGTEEDWAEVAIVFERSSMSWGFNSFYYPPGNYQIIFGIWKGNVAVTNSGWIAFKVESDSPVSDPDDMDGTAEYNPNYGKVFVSIPDDEVTNPSDDADDANLAVESWEEIQEKSYQAPFTSRYVYLSPRTHFLFDHQPAVSPNEALITRKTHGLMVSASGMDYYPIDLISSLGGTVRYEGNFIALQLGENEALLDLDSQTVIADNDVYPIDPIWHRSDIAITADSVNLPTGFYRGFFGIHPVRMSITQEDTAYAEEFGNAHDEGPALIRDWVIGSVFGHFIGKAAIILVSRAASAIATKFLVTGLSREAAVIATVEAERAVVSGMAKTVLSRLPRATSYEVSLAVEKRLFTKMAEATGEKAQKGILGEINLVRAFRKMGIDIHPDFIHLGHGFDNVGTMGERIVVGEAKYVSEGLFRLSNLPVTKLSGKQMSKQWVDYAAGLLRKSGKVALADGVDIQLESGLLKKILVITRPSGKVYGVEDAVLDLFDIVIEVDLSGLELARYLR